MKTWRRGFVRKFSPANRMGEEKLSGIEIPFCAPVKTLDWVQALVPDHANLVADRRQRRFTPNRGAGESRMSLES